MDKVKTYQTNYSQDQLIELYIQKSNELNAIMDELDAIFYSLDEESIKKVK